VGETSAFLATDASGLKTKTSYRDTQMSLYKVAKAAMTVVFF